MTWSSDLRPASWRGIPFSALSVESRFGRRTAVHEYPFRNSVWVEDLGLRKLQVIGILVGNDVLAQQTELIAAAESPGPGELVHPTFGTLTVSLLEFSAAARWDQGRVVELFFGFVETGGSRFPAAQVATADAVRDAASALDRAVSAAYSGRMGDLLTSGSEVARQTTRTVQGWTQQAQRAAGDAAAVVNAVGSLVPGSGKALSRLNRGFRDATQPLRTAQDGLRRVTSARRAWRRPSDQEGWRSAAPRTRCGPQRRSAWFRSTRMTFSRR